MFRAAGVMLLVGAMVAVLCQAAFAVDLQGDYYKAIGTYYNVATDDVKEISQVGISDEDLPVVFFVSGQVEITPKEVAKMRHSGATWMAVCDKYNLPVSDFYVFISGSVDSKVYGPIYEKFNKTPKQKLNSIKLTDDEIVNLVNLKMVYSLHDYSVFDIMAMRDYGKTFARINQQVHLAKKEMNEEQDKALEAR
jgi:hypothetical protein